MSDIKLDRCDVVNYVKNTLNNSKTNFDDVTDAKYHHNTKYCDASSVIRLGILTMSELNKLKLRHDSPECQFAKCGRIIAELGFVFSTK